ncbi:membrane hypothetical protein [Mesorhizobium delmotii]|uniref:Uncharacterized protein n=1 Tax=Mesorhizobium delmotii TaxID=1631247 RepID=A0A2P9AQM7_9HYPH|nr:membrane hypothetical protein [Mesorhizobium delmotii]
MVSSSKALAPHWLMRKSFHFMPFSVLPTLAARYFAPHSALLRPLPALAVTAALVVAAAAASGVAALVLSALPGVASVAAATVAHSALRNWFQFCPPSVPASFAALYLVLHSAMVSALAGAARNKVTTARPVKVASRWMIMRLLPQVFTLCTALAIALNDWLRQRLNGVKAVGKCIIFYEIVASSGSPGNFPGRICTENLCRADHSQELPHMTGRSGRPVRRT